MISSINDKAAEAARMMTEWVADELRAIGLPVSVAIKKGVPGRVIIEEAQEWKADSIFVGSRKFSGRSGKVLARQCFCRSSDEGALFSEGCA